MDLIFLLPRYVMISKDAHTPCLFTFWNSFILVTIGYGGGQQGGRGGGGYDRGGGESWQLLVPC